MAQKKVLGTRVDQKVYDAIKHLASQTNRTPSQVAAMILEDKIRELVTDEGRITGDDLKKAIRQIAY